MEKPDNQQKNNELNQPVQQPTPKKQSDKKGNGGAFKLDGIPSVATQKQSNGMQKGAAILVFGGGIILMMLLGFAAVIKSDKKEATDKANAAKKQAATAPNFKLPDPPLEALPPLGASAVSQPVEAPVIIEQSAPTPPVVAAPPPVQAEPAQPVIVEAPKDLPPTPDEIRMRSPLMVGGGAMSQPVSLGGSSQVPTGEWNGDLSEGENIAEMVCLIMIIESKDKRL